MDNHSYAWAIKLKIHELKQKLAATNDTALEFAEGELSAVEYAPVREQRRAWRIEIRQLEEQLAAL